MLPKAPHQNGQQTGKSSTWMFTIPRTGRHTFSVRIPFKNSLLVDCANTDRGVHAILECSPSWSWAPSQLSHLDVHLAPRVERDCQTVLFNQENIDATDSGSVLLSCRVDTCFHSIQWLHSSAEYVVELSWRCPQSSNSAECSHFCFGSNIVTEHYWLWTSVSRWLNILASLMIELYLSY